MKFFFRRITLINFATLLNLIILSAVLLSCRTMADYDFTNVDSCVQNGNFFLATELLDSDSKLIYSSHDEVLRLLDKGLLLHYAGSFEESNSTLSEGEKKMEIYFSKSVTQAIGSAVVNDTVTDYAGESYEDIYTNIFMCLNYIHLGLFDDAMVEIRRFDNKMKVLGSKYQSIIDSSQYGDEVQIKDASKVKFHNSALARYLSMIIYRTNKNYDDARIDLNNIKNAFALQQELYNFSMPSEQFLEEELSVPKNLARLNLISFYGLGPTKKEEVLRLPLNKVYYKIALPYMRARKTSVSYVQVTAKNNTTGELYSTILDKIESIENIAYDTFKQHYAAIMARSLLRSVGKTASSTALNVASDQTEDDLTSSILSILGFGMQIMTEATERADVRICRYFPSTVSVGGINVTPGIYDVRLDFCTLSGNVIASSFTNSVEVQSEKLNLVEGACLR